MTRLADEIVTIGDADAFRLATPQLAYHAVRDALVAAASDQAWNNPVVIAPGLEAGESFSLKSGGAREARLLGAKIGSFWPRAVEAGLPRHSSVVVLLDPNTGRASTIVEAGSMNGRRTAAANAVATNLLARADSRILSVIGAGAQARYEVEALARVRPFEGIMIASREIETAGRLAERLRESGLPASAASIRQACEAADVLVTATPSRAPLFDADWIRPGTHISAMGADQRGKQELPPELFARAALFADTPEQSVVIGEFQWTAPDDRERLIAIGEVIASRASGRIDERQITIFDSSGLALQDLFVAAAVEQAWRIEQKTIATARD